MNDIWNPWHGCRKISEGCLNCYMFRMDASRGADGGRIYRVKNNFSLPLKKDRQGSYKVPSGMTLRVCMTSDFFLKEADEWRDAVWQTMRLRPDVHFWLLTKRASRIRECLPPDWGEGYDNVSLNVSIENQKRADERLPILLDIPAKHRGAMAAPLIEPLSIGRWLDTGLLEEILADGENYDGARPLRYEWVKSLYEECASRKIRFTFCGIGNEFIMNGRVYHVPKAYQHAEAQRSGLQYPPLEREVRLQPRCAKCPRRFYCSGCTWCGRCGTGSAL